MKFKSQIPEEQQARDVFFAMFACFLFGTVVGALLILVVQ